jgi:hypothetical protein
MKTLSIKKKKGTPGFNVNLNRTSRSGNLNCHQAESNGHHTSIN